MIVNYFFQCIKCKGVIREEHGEHSRQGYVTYALDRCVHCGLDYGSTSWNFMAPNVRSDILVVWEEKRK